MRMKRRRDGERSSRGTILKATLVSTLYWGLVRSREVCAAEGAYMMRLEGCGRCGAFLTSSLEGRKGVVERVASGVYERVPMAQQRPLVVAAGSPSEPPRRRCPPRLPQPKKGGLTPAEQLQHAVTPEEILSCASMHAANGRLKPAHLSQAVLRIGRALLQPREEPRRLAISKDPRLGQVLSAWQAASSGNMGVRQMSDFLFGLAMLQYNVDDTLLSDMMEAFEKDCQPDGTGMLRGEDVTNVEWSLQRLGRPDLLPTSLKARVDGLPFKVLLGALAEERLDVTQLMEEVAFQKDMIQVAGKEVEEQRLTAWQGPRSFLYSGKEMAPSPMTPTVARVRDALHAKTGYFFDCVLLNLYNHGRIGMSYHIDPDQGVLWTDKTAVVSVGEVRQFCMRRIEEHSDRYRFLVSGGDVVLMTDDCQQVFQHCVRKEDSAEEAGPRISLVYKQSLHLREDGT